MVGRPRSAELRKGIVTVQSEFSSVKFVDCGSRNFLRIRSSYRLNSSSSTTVCLHLLQATGSSLKNVLVYGSFLLHVVGQVLTLKSFVNRHYGSSKKLHLQMIYSLCTGQSINRDMEV